jgi:hypothetical protein
MTQERRASTLLNATAVAAVAAASFGQVAACSTSNSPTAFGNGSSSSGGSSDDGGATADGEPSQGSSNGGSSGSSGSPSASGSGGASSGSSGGSSGSGSSGADAAGGAEAGAEASSGGTASSGIVTDGDAGACPTPSGLTADQTTALQIINQTRAAMGSPCDNIVPALDTSATKHCVYYAANVNNATCVADPHVEVSSCTDYVSANFEDRETAAGYNCMPSLTQSCEASEVMAFDDNPTVALGQWIGSIYHRSPLLDPRMRDFGYGNATGCDTIDLGEGAGSTTPDDVIVSYPYNGQTGVALSFNGALEEPTPPVPPNGWPSALPIHVYMAATSITLTTDDFGIQGGAQLAHQVLTPQASQGYLVNAIVLYGNAPLVSQTTYQVHIAGTRQNQGYSTTTTASFDVSFSFTTQ